MNKANRKGGAGSRLKREISGRLKALPILAERRHGIAAAATTIIETATLARSYLALCDKFDSKNKPNLLRGVLQRIDRQSQQLIECIEQLPPNTFDAIRIALCTRPLGEPVLELPLDKLQLPPRSRLVADLKQLHEACSRALRRRRPGNRLASEVTNVTAFYYMSLTGKTAAPGVNSYTEQRSEFECLLTDIFDVLGIDASAERQAKNLARQKKMPRHLARRLLRDG